VVSAAVALRPEASTSDTSTDDDDGLVHWVCCHDEDAAYCGTPMADAVLIPTPGDADCVVCVDLGADVTYCPRYGRCAR
jgi:hypothetical protein